MRGNRIHKKMLTAFLIMCQVFALVLPCKTTMATGIEENAVQEIDLGDYETEMEVGGRQLLNVTVLPLNAVEQEIVYSSSNEQIAIINGMGRITAVAVGTTEILVSCGGITASFVLNVVEPKTEETVEVADIEIADFEEELDVDKTMNLSVTVLPAEAADTKTIYSSSNTQIATVSSAGEVKGIAPGQVTITIQAGKVSKSVAITVKVPTTAIDLNSTYVVLKCGETYQISGSVIPKEANQNLSFKSADVGVATVSGGGMIKAKSVGNTTIIVSNGDMSNAVTVIVNEEGKIPVDEATEVCEQKTEKNSVQEAMLLAMLEQQDVVQIKADEYEKITSVVLKEMYIADKELLIEGENYTMRLSGRDIVNCKNELYTKLEQKQIEQGMEVVLNKGKNLPGRVMVDFSEKESYKYVYLYNDIAKRYERIQQEKKTSEIQMDTPGTYLFTNTKVKDVMIKVAIIIIVGIIVLALAGGYIIMKKKYWFW